MQTGIPPNQNDPQPDQTPIIQVNPFGLDDEAVKDQLGYIVGGATGLIASDTSRILAMLDNNTGDIVVPWLDQFENAQPVRLKTPIYEVTTLVNFEAGGTSHQDGLQVHVRPKIFKVAYKSSSFTVYYTNELTLISTNPESIGPVVSSSIFRFTSQGMGPTYEIIGGQIDEIPFYAYGSQPISNTQKHFNQQRSSNVSLPSMTLETGPTRIDNRKSTLLSRLFRKFKKKGK